MERKAIGKKTGGRDCIHLKRSRDCIHLKRIESKNKMNIELPCDSGIPLLGIYTQDN